MSVGAPRRWRGAALTAVVIAELAPRYGAKPAAKGVAGPFLAKRVDVDDNGAKNVLNDVSNVLLGDLSTARPEIDQGGVQLDEFFPGLAVAMTDTVEQAARG